MGKSEGSSENWLMTYGDLVTLLLVFFVLLYTLTPGVEDEVFDSFISYFQKSPGFFDAKNINTSEAQMDPEELEDAMEAMIAQWQSFADFLEEYELTSEVNVQLLSTGIMITLSDSLTFNSGSAELLPDAQLVLGKVADQIDRQFLEIEVQGHTDNVPISSASFYKSNWHLGAARAVSVVQFLQQEAETDPAKFKASSYGEFKPVQTNETTEGRRANRRVEIYLRNKRKTTLADSLVTDVWF